MVSIYQEVEAIVPISDELPPKRIQAEVSQGREGPNVFLLEIRIGILRYSLYLKYRIASKVRRALVR